MAIITLPDALAVREFTMGQRRYDLSAVSDVNGSSQARLFGPPRWLCSFQCPPGMDADDADLWEATLLQLRGRVNHLALHDRRRPVPRGTLRGSPTLNATVAAGATSMVITGGVGTNLLTYSKSFDNAIWAKTQMATTTANAISAPDGTTTADKLIPNTTTSVSHYVEQSLAGLLDNATYSAAVYLKAAELPRAMLQIVAKNGSGPQIALRFSDGRIVHVSQGTGQAGVTFSAETLADGWFRVCIHGASLLTGGTTPRIRIFPIENPGINSGVWSETGATATRGAIASPVSGWTGDSLVESAGGTFHYTNASLNFVTGRGYHVEAYLRALGSGATRWGSFVVTGTTALGATQTINIDLSTGAVTLQSGSRWSGVTVTDAGSGWWKLEADLSAIGTGAVGWQIRLSDTSTGNAPSYSGDGASGMYVAAPYAYPLAADTTSGIWASQNATSELVANGTDGFYAWGAQFQPGATAGDYEPGGGSVKAGDWLGLGSGVGTSQLVKATATSYAAETGLLTVAFEPPARIAFSSAGAVTWDKPLAYFKSQSDEWAGRGITSQVFSGYGLDLVEDWTP
jgi:hypothetical protein